MQSSVLILATFVVFGLFLYYYKKANSVTNKYYEQKQTDIGFWNYIYVAKLRETISGLGGRYNPNDVTQYDVAKYLAELKKRMLESFSDKKAIDEYLSIVSNLTVSYAQKRGDIVGYKRDLEENARKLVKSANIDDWQEHLNMMYIYMESNTAEKLIDAISRSVTALRAIDSNI